jgi:hypothetical protein
MITFKTPAAYDYSKIFFENWIKARINEPNRHLLSYKYV